MESIKIGRKEYKIKEGDFVLDNGACFQFCAGDGRVLKMKGYTSYSSLVIPKTIVKQLPLNEMNKKEVTRSGMKLTEYYF